MICVLGDAHLDVVVAVRGQFAEETDTDAAIVAGAGGQAANVAAWVAALGGRARLIAARGTDPAAGLVAAELAGRGVELVGPVIAGRTGVVVSLSAGGGVRSMLTDRGVGPMLSAADLDSRWLDGCDWLHLPAYSLVAEPVRAAALAAAALAPRLSVDLSSTAALRGYGVARFRELLAGLGPDLVFGNEAEAELVGGLPGSEVIVKLGPRGVLAAGKRHPALPVTPADSTGAGDAFAAGYLVGGIALGLEAAARAVARMGAMP
ncbi:MAG TPA: carbohydrate kinase family protein [Streptosporangiaceae bacterium]